MERDSGMQNLDAAASAEGSGDKKGMDDVPQPPSPNALKVAATECLNSWIYYLQMLNSLCTAGLRLSQSFTSLAQSQNNALASQCQASWDELARSTVVASHSVKTHIAAAMQDLCIGETFTEADAQRQQEHNQQIIMENILTFVNLQYQFSIAGCECLGAMAMCPQCQTTAGGIHDPECHMAPLQQCFARLIYSQNLSTSCSPPPSTSHLLESPRDAPPSMSLGGFSHSMRGHSPGFEGGMRGTSPVYGQPMQLGGFIETVRGPLPNPGQLHTMKGPFPGPSRCQSRSPLHFPLFPLAGGQRRWSEAAAPGATNVSGSGVDLGDGGTQRRWSMPWDCGRTDDVQTATTSAAASSPWHQRYLPSKLAVPPGGGGTSGPGSDRSRSTTPEAFPGPCIPAEPGTITSGEGLAEAIQLLSCRPMRCAIPHQGQSLQNAPFGPPPWSETHEDRINRRFPGPMQRGNWQSMDSPHSSGMPTTEHYDIFPAGIPMTSRKSSSSTDSSSCLSIHSRSTTSGSDRGGGSDNSGGPDAIRMHTGNIYSMWSGNEHLPFIRLPESQEPLDDSDADETLTEGGHRLFPKPI